MRDLLFDVDDTVVQLLHYEEFPVTLDRTRTYDQRVGRMSATGKPTGLWVSARNNAVDDDMDWEAWCRSEEFHLTGLAHVHQVTLRADANVLWIKTATELDAFHLAWSHETEFEREMTVWRKEYDRKAGYDLEGRIQGNGLTFSRNQWPIDWDKVAAQWDGIIITPYLWSRRLDGPFWYYGMDCSSGCIWNLSAIDTFEEVTDAQGR